MVKSPPSNAGDIRDKGLIPGSGRSPGGGHGNLLQCSCLENPRGQRRLVGYSPWGHKESDMTERLNTAQHPSIGPSRESREKVNTLRKAVSPQRICKTRNRTWGQGCLLFNRQTQLEAEEAPEYPIK